MLNGKNTSQAVTKWLTVTVFSVFSLLSGVELLALSLLDLADSLPDAGDCSGRYCRYDDSSDRDQMERAYGRSFVGIFTSAALIAAGTIPTVKDFFDRRRRFPLQLLLAPYAELFSGVTLVLIAILVDNFIAATVYLLGAILLISLAVVSAFRMQVNRPARFHFRAATYASSDIRMSNPITQSGPLTPYEVAHYVAIVLGILTGVLFALILHSAI
ncbi:hypothetical protein ACX6XY_07275 [Streptomyces sp. O3]